MRQYSEIDGLRLPVNTTYLVTSLRLRTDSSLFFCDVFSSWPIVVEIVVSSPVLSAMALHPRSDCLSKELVRLRSDTSVYPFRIVTNLHDFNSTEACVTNVVQSPVQCGPGQIAPPLMMLLSSACCKHNRSKAAPPSSLDGWGC